MATRDTEIAGTFIPKGSYVGITLAELHCNPNVWRDPDTFDHERFAPGGEVDQLKGLPWTPFGNGGARVCPAVRSTMTQISIFFVMLCKAQIFKQVLA